MTTLSTHTSSHFVRRLRRTVVALSLTGALALGCISCGSTGTYWGVDQHYPVGNGSVYYGAYGGDGPHHRHYSKKEYKKYRKEQKKLRKKQEKLRKKQMKHARKHHRHHHHDD